MQLGALHQQGLPMLVSILIQPEDRMQPVVIGVNRVARYGFNPHPARRPDATYRTEVSGSVYDPVSILIQPEDRMQHPWAHRHSSQRCACFNPHPARRPDATPGYVFSTQSSRTSPVASEIGQMACNCSVCFPHVLSMNANLLLTGAIAIGSRHASSGSVKSITLPCPYSSTR